MAYSNLRLLFFTLGSTILHFDQEPIQSDTLAFKSICQRVDFFKSFLQLFIMHIPDPQLLFQFAAGRFQLLRNGIQLLDACIVLSGTIWKTLKA